jgi:iron complex transport system ATP-binding protein
MIKLDNVTYSYNKSQSLFNNINLEIKGGKFITILGPNGCGKSTLLKLISGQIEAKKGSVLHFIDDDYVDICSREPKQLAKHFSFISQRNSNIFPYTCFDFVLLGRRPYRDLFEDYSNEDFSIVEHIMKKTDTFQFANKKLSQISGGESQRIIFAKALAQKTKLLILDEAFSAMDIKYRIKCLDYLKELVKEDNNTVISVMHDMNLAYKYSDYIFLLNHGEIHKEGVPDTVLNIDIIKEVYGITVEKVYNKGFIIIGGK